MIIQRNGNLIKLTPEELRLAATEYNRECYGDDAMGKFEKMISESEENFPLSEQDYVNMSKAESKVFESHAVSAFEKYLNKNVDYYEAFWASVEQAVKDTAKLHSTEGMTFSLLKEIFCTHEKGESEKPYYEQQHLTAHITISPDSFTKKHTEEERTYEVSSDNKFFRPDQIGSSLFGTSLDGQDVNVRLDRYLQNLGTENGWKIEKIRLIREEQTAL